MKTWIRMSARLGISTIALLLAFSSISFAEQNCEVEGFVYNVQGDPLDCVHIWIKDRYGDLVWIGMSGRLDRPDCYEELHGRYSTFDSPYWPTWTTAWLREHSPLVIIAYRPQGLCVQLWAPIVEADSDGGETEKLTSATELLRSGDVQYKIVFYSDFEGGSNLCDSYLRAAVDFYFDDDPASTLHYQEAEPVY